ncbi:DUF3175 domain-containing protein
MRALQHRHVVIDALRLRTWRADGRGSLAAVPSCIEEPASQRLMLNFYINRAGQQLSKAQRTKLEKAKDELRKDFGRKPKG